MKSCFLASCAASIIFAAAPAVASAEDTYHFNLPSQSLASSLLAASRSAHVSVVFDPALVRGREAPAIRGSYSVEQVISSLLRETDLTVRRVSDKSYLIVAKTTAPRLIRASRKELQADPAPLAAAAPMSAPANTVGLEEIIFTAQKREESLQKTPISIAVLNSKALQERGITNLSDFVNGAVPSLRVVPIIGRPPSEKYNISVDPTECSLSPAPRGTAIPGRQTT